MLPDGWTEPQAKVFAWACWDDPPALARTLYTGLRALDELGVSVILCPLPAPGELPLVQAIRDRLTKAARVS
jgi:L-threonylcarbamoyladenylate synthase